MICDIHMPPHAKPQGYLLVRELRKDFPKMPVLMHSDDMPVLLQLKRQNFPFVYKLDSQMFERLERAVRRELNP